MRRILLMLVLVASGLVAFAQTSFMDRLNIKRANDKVNIQVFPNPVDNHINITESNEVSRVAVFNLVGRKLKSFKYVKGESYFIGDLPKGIYLVQLMGKLNNVIVTQRVSKR